MTRASTCGACWRVSRSAFFRFSPFFGKLSTRATRRIVSWRMCPGVGPTSRATRRIDAWPASISLVRHTRIRHVAHVGALAHAGGLARVAGRTEDSGGRPNCVTRVRGTFFSDGRPNCVTRVRGTFFLGWSADLCYTGPRYLFLGWSAELCYTGPRYLFSDVRPNCCAPRVYSPRCALT